MHWGLDVEHLKLVSKHLLMGRPRTITNEQILEAAETLFLAHGPTVPTSEIAQKLNISEATIFKRFPTKEALLKEALQFEPIDLDEFLDSRVGVEPVPIVLNTLIRKLVRFYKVMIPRAMMLRQIHAFDPMKEFMDNPESPPLRGLHAISRYLASERDAHRIRLRDPEPVARMVMGAAMNLASFSWMQIPGHDRLDDAQYAEEVVQILLDGISLQGGSS
jgi:AcrR family transcriptional regulator